MHNQEKENLASSGFGYFLLGFKLITLKGIKRFVFIPLIVNLILFYCAFSFLFQQLDFYILQLNNYLPDFLTWLSALLWPLTVIIVIVVFSFVFSSIANWLAAPFNGLLSEKIEGILSNDKTLDSGFNDIIKDIPRTFSREWQKLAYYIPRALGFLLLFFVLPVIGQVLWFLFVAWMMAIQYKDYPFDNHKIPFAQMRSTLHKNKQLSFSFGITTSLFSMIPIINLIVMPVAICGATALWVEQYKPLMKEHE